MGVGIVGSGEPLGYRGCLIGRDIDLGRSIAVEYSGAALAADVALRPAGAPGVEVAVVVIVDEVGISVADAVEGPFLAKGIAIVSAHGLEGKVTAVEIEPRSNFVLLSMAADEDVGQTIMVDIGHGRCGAIDALKAAVAVAQHGKGTIAAVVIDKHRLGVAALVAGVARDQDIEQAVGIKVGRHAP